MNNTKAGTFRSAHLHGLSGPRCDLSTPEERAQFIGPVELPPEKDHPREDVGPSYPDTNDYYAEMASYC